MYKILIRNRELNQTDNFKFSFYSENGSIFQSEDLTVVEEKFKELMNSYLVSDIQIVKAIETSVAVDAQDDCEHSTTTNPGGTTTVAE